MLPPRRRAPPRLRGWRRGLRRPRVDARYIYLLSLLATVLGVLGYSLTEVLSDTAGVSLLVLAVVIGVGLIFLPSRTEDTYHGKPEVDWAWDETIRRADESIDIVAGDIDWLLDDRKLARVIAFKCADGCSVRVVCKPPATSPYIRDGIASLLQACAHVRVRPPDLPFIPTTGILTDRDSDADRAALRVRVNRMTGELADPAEKVYWAKRDVAKRDHDHLESWQALVGAYWDRSTPAVLLERLPDGVEEAELFERALRSVPTYSSAPSFSVQDVDVSTLWSWCLREDKLNQTRLVVSQFTPQKLSYFDTCLCWSGSGATVLLPPIVEIHDSRLVVMDGAHRLWHVFQNNPHAAVRVIVVSTSTALPGEPRPLQALPFFRERLGERRAKHITAYDPTRWRSFTPMEVLLRGLGQDYVRRTLDDIAERHGLVARRAAGGPGIPA